MTTKEIIDQLRFRYYSPKHFEGVVVTDFDKFDLYQKLNTSYHEGVTEIRYEDKVVFLSGCEDLTSVRLYEAESLVGALDLEYDVNIARDLNLYMHSFRSSTTPELFLKRYLTGKFFTNCQEFEGYKIYVWRNSYLYDVIREIVRSNTPRLKIDRYTINEKGIIIGEFNFGATHIR